MRHKTIVGFGVLLILLLQCMGMTTSARCEEDSYEIPEWLERVEFSIQMETHKKPIYYFQTVQPLYQNDDKAHTVFIQPRVSLQEERNDFSLGFGYRNLFNEDFVQIVGDKMVCSEYALPGTSELASNAIKGLGNYNGVLLPNHGTLVVGPDMPMALTICHVVEKTAHIYIMAKSIGTPNLISMEDIKAMQDYVRNKYGQNG